MGILDDIRAAVKTAKPLAETFHTAKVSFYDPNSTTNTVPVLVCSGRFKKPRPSAFDAGNQNEWATARRQILKVPLEFTTIDGVDYSTVKIIEEGWVAQVEPADSAHVDGDPTLYGISWTVQSALVSQFAAEREVNLLTEVRATPRIS